MHRPQPFHSCQKVWVARRRRPRTLIRAGILTSNWKATGVTDNGSLNRLMAEVPLLPSATFTQSQLIIAENVYGVEQGNHPDPEGEVLAFLPAGVPHEIVPSQGDAISSSGKWLVSQRPSTDPIPLPTARRAMPELVAMYRGLRRWCRTHEGDEHILLGFDSLSRVANALIELDPDSVIDLFDEMEPSLKFGGDFKMVMRYGRLIELACHRSERRDQRTVERLTQATTCAVSWVFQRTGLLSAAEHQLSVDETLNRDVDELRGLAFTLKCRGRLRRLMAERSDFSPSQVEAEKFLRLSLDDLAEARQMFQRIADGDRTAQVCDTDALQSRTHLTRGDLLHARQSLERALFFEVAALKKTIFDCLILADELDWAQGLRPMGQASPTPSIERVIESTEGPGYERNEIRARALFAKGRLRASAGDDYAEPVEQALSIYERLGDRNAAAQISLWRLRHEALIDDELRRLLGPYTPDVQLRAYTSYSRRYGAPVPVASMNRQRDETDPRWTQIIQTARRESAIHFEGFQ
jgi:hypothetical protein